MSAWNRAAEKASIRREGMEEILVWMAPDHLSEEELLSSQWDRLIEGLCGNKIGISLISENRGRP